MTTLRGNLVTHTGVITNGTVSIQGTQISHIDGSARVDVDLGDAFIFPGFVDQHCHGGGQADVSTASAREVAQFHLQHGTTTMLASLVTASPTDLLDQVARLRDLIADDVFAGIHLEGPWLSHLQCGAHDPALLRSPDADEIAALLAVADGSIRMATMAPELPHAIEAIPGLVDAGVVVAIGHTNCDYETTAEAIAAGATVATHLFNRMPPLEKRLPGPVLALLEDESVTVELIADGVHVDPRLIRYVINTAGPMRVAVVTDAMAAAGAPDGPYKIGALDVQVADGVARLADSGALAGSTLTMDAALKVLVGDCGLEVSAAAQCLSTAPAKALGFDDRGVIAPGKRADLVVTDQDFNVTAVMRSGSWVVGL